MGRRPPTWQVALSVLGVFSALGALGLFNASGFMRRGMCGAWSEGFMVLYQGANLLTFLAYLAFPAALIGLKGAYERVYDDGAVRVAVAAFVLSCGIGHLEGVISFYWPAYHLFAAWHVITAACSWWAILVLIWFRGTVKG